MTFLLAINTAAAVVAAVVNLWAAHRVRVSIVTAVSLIRGVLAAAYAASMGADIAGIVDTTDRITLVQSLGLLAWPLVWILPAITIGRGYARESPRDFPEQVASAVAKQLTQDSRQ